MTADSTHAPSRRTLTFIRWTLPALICVGGLIAFLIHPSIDSADGAAGVIGAGLSTMMIAWFFRVGAEGDEERHVEDAARDYLGEHGHWPTDQEYANFKRHGDWTAPKSEDDRILTRV